MKAAKYERTLKITACLSDGTPSAMPCFAFLVLLGMQRLPGYLEINWNYSSHFIHIKGAHL